MPNEIGYQLEEPKELNPQEIALEQQKAPTSDAPTADKPPGVQEQSVPSQENTAATQPQLEFQVRPADQFAAHVDEYSKLEPAVLKYIVETKHAELAQENSKDNPFLKLSSEESAALLLAIDGSTAQNSEDPTQKNPLVEELRARVLLDTNAAKLYFPERMNQLTPPELIQEIITLADTLKRNENVSLAYLQSVNAARDSKQAEIDPLITMNLDAQEALFTLEDELQKPEYRLAAITQATENILEANDPETEQVLASLSSDVEIQATQRTSPDELTVTVKVAGSPELKKVKVTEANIWGTALYAVVADTLFGGRNSVKLAEIWTQYNVTFPLLAKMGVDTEKLNSTFAPNKFDAFDNTLRIMNDKTCQVFFEDAVRNRVLFDILETCRPEHLQKIFHPNGPKAFGEYDDLHISADLVKKMRENLTKGQRNQLQIPELKPQTTVG